MTPAGQGANSGGAQSRGAIRFILGGRIHTVGDVDPNATVLAYLREIEGRTGTKEGCAEGDCGACTVVLVDLNRNAPESPHRYRAVNACIQLLPTLDGKEILTVEDLREPSGALHPVQEAMVQGHGSQCGFCTPGIVMSLFAMYKSQGRPERRQIDDCLAGNLCRCTGYRPIIDAAHEMYRLAELVPASNRHRLNAVFEPNREGEIRGEADSRERHEALGSAKPLRYQWTGPAGTVKQFFAPTELEDALALRGRYPEAHILAGGTDVGLWVTKEHRDLATVIYLGKVRDLDTIEADGNCLELGATTTLTDVYPLLAETYPDLGELVRRFASPPIRNTATLAGNIANGSPIGDCMPALIALGASVVLRSPGAERELALEDLYLDYRKTAMAADEIITRVRVPLPRQGQLFRAYKVTKRLDQDISAVCGAFSLTLDRARGNLIESARVGYGGMAAIPARAANCERALIGKRWGSDSVASALEALDEDFEPISDLRASRDYRRRTAANLLVKFHLETTGPAAPLRVCDISASRAGPGG